MFCRFVLVRLLVSHKNNYGSCISFSDMSYVVYVSHIFKKEIAVAVHFVFPP